MKCSDARFAVAANPGSVDTAVDDHIGSCAACAAYACDMRELDDRLRAALTVPVPEIRLPTDRPSVVRFEQPRRHLVRRFALAASIAGVALLAGLLWIGVPKQSLASAVVAHMAHEPDAWTRTVPLVPASVAPVLARSGVSLRDGMTDVSYANSCWFRGHFVPHLVVQTPGGPVTVMILPDEHVAARVPFDEGGYRGMLVPAQRGAIAVLARGAANVEAVVSRALDAIAYAD